MKNKSLLLTLCTMAVIAIVVAMTSISILKEKEQQFLDEQYAIEQQEKAKKLHEKMEFNMQEDAIIYSISREAMANEAIKKQKITLAEIEKKKEEERLEAERQRLIALEEEKKRQIAIEQEKQRVVATQTKTQSTKKQEEKKTEFVAVSRSSTNSVTYQMTSYTASCKGCSGITASGYDVRNTIYYNGLRIVAVPPEIPLGTVMRITLPSGASFMAIGLDRGGAIKGKKLDFLVGSYDEAISNGRMTVQVEMSIQ